LKILIEDRPIVELAMGENVLITFAGDPRNLLVEMTENGIETSWSKTEISPEMAAQGWVAVPGSERDYADLIERANDPRVPDL
jgi:hypothetical protein